jgi:hypothetical protein
MALTPIPTFPPIGSGTFNADAYAWATFMAGTHQTELDALVLAVDADATTATTQAALATTNGAAQVTLATTQAVNAAASASAAAGSAATAGAAIWVSGTTYSIGDARYSPTDLQTYRRKTSGAGTTDPASDSTNWARVVLGSGSGGAVNASGSVVLTSNSGGAQSVTPSAFGQSVTLPDARTCTQSGYVFTLTNAGPYPMRVMDYTGATIGFLDAYGGAVLALASTSTAAGVWNTRDLLPYAVTAQGDFPTLAGAGTVTRIGIDANRTMILFTSPSSTLYAVVYDASTGTWGTPVSVRAPGSVLYKAILSATNQVLVVSCGSGAAAFEAVTLTVSTTTVTVNTAATATLASNLAGQFDLIAVGTSWVVSYSRSGVVSGIRAMTISGTTVTIGAESALSGLNIISEGPHLYAVSTTVVLAFTATISTGIYVKPFTVSGSTLSAGTEATIAANATTIPFRTFTFGTRWGVVFYGNSDFTSASVVSVSGTTATASTLQNIVGNCTGAPTTTADVVVYGNRFAVMVSSNGATSAPAINVITDTAGTASQGTYVSIPASSMNATAALGISGALASFLTTGSSGGILRSTWNISGASATLSSTQARAFGTGDVSQVAPSGTKDLVRNGGLLTGSINLGLPANTAINTLAVNTGLLTSFKAAGTLMQGTYLNGGAANVAWVTANSQNYAAFQRIEAVA